MRIRVPLVGTGAPGDNFRANLPTYVMVAEDFARGIAVVEIPDADLPDHPGLRAALSALADLPTANQAPLAAALRAAWHDHLDARYREHAGRFRPDRK